MSDFEREDMELEAVMGGKFLDVTRDPIDKPVETPGCEGRHKPVKNVPANEKTAKAKWLPVKPEPSFMYYLKATTKEVCFYGALSLIVFWWQQTGKLEETTAWYALLVCVGMVFFSVGKNWRGWCK